MVTGTTGLPGPPAPMAARGSGLANATCPHPELEERTVLAMMSERTFTRKSHVMLMLILTLGYQDKMKILTLSNSLSGLCVDHDPSCPSRSDQCFKNARDTANCLRTCNVCTNTAGKVILRMIDHPEVKYKLKDIFLVQIRKLHTFSLY